MYTAAKSVIKCVVTEPRRLPNRWSLRLPSLNGPTPYEFRLCRPAWWDMGGNTYPDTHSMLHTGFASVSPKVRGPHTSGKNLL